MTVKAAVIDEIAAFLLFLERRTRPKKKSGRKNRGIFQKARFLETSEKKQKEKTQNPSKQGEEVVEAEVK